MPCWDVAADATPAIRRVVARSRVVLATQDVVAKTQVVVVPILAAATIPAVVPDTGCDILRQVKLLLQARMLVAPLVPTQG